MTRAPLLIRLHAYQQARFPLIPLVLSFIPAIASSGAVVSATPALADAAAALVAAVAYLFHIRIIDEHRDFEHDALHHPTRPIQSGLISKQELAAFDIVPVALLVLIGAANGPLAFAIALGMLLYSFVAQKEFFLGERLRRRFFLYNAVNIGQMLLMQAFVYALFANSFPMTTLVFAHFLFTAVGTLIFEFIRKVRLPDEEGSGKDTYSWHLGFRNALIVFIALVGLDCALFLAVAGAAQVSLVPYALAAFLGCAFAVAFHHSRRKRATERLMQGSFLLAYAALNLALFLSIDGLW